MPMKIVVSGGNGRLGKLVVPALKRMGHIVVAPERRTVDWANYNQANWAVQGFDIVLALAAWTDVHGAQEHPTECVRDTVVTIQNTIRAVERSDTRIFYISTDYVLPLLRAEQGAGVYAASKLVAEQLVLGAHNERHFVARAAFVTEEQVKDWKWVDGVSRSCRLWDAQIARYICTWTHRAYATDFDKQHTSRITTFGTEPTTMAELLRARYPNHQALNNVITSETEIGLVGKGLRPANTVW